MNPHTKYILLFCAFVLSSPGFSAQKKPSPATRNADYAPVEDPVLAAMLTELERSKAGLRMDQVAPPYYIEYIVTDYDEYEALATFGALRRENRNHQRILQATVRIGDYRQDSYTGRGAIDEMPIDDNPLVLRHQLWLATDRAYKAAAETLAAKVSMLKQVVVDDLPNDFAQSQALRQVDPVARLDFDAGQWRKTLEDCTALYQHYPDFLDITAMARFVVVNRYLVNSEGTVTRTGRSHYLLSTIGAAQAADGMMLLRTPDILVAVPNELPSTKYFMAFVKEMLDSLQALRKAPIVTEEYRGPVLFLTDASNDIIAGLVANNLLGRRPSPGSPARTSGDYANSLNTKVLPDFLTIVDDPTISNHQDKSLAGSYAVDDEGVKSRPVTLVENGKLINYLIGRTPIRGFPTSNGHGRSTVAGSAVPGYSNMFLRPAVSFSRVELKNKMLDICRDRHLSYGYMVETLGGVASPRLIYRIFVEDGRQELVRGAAVDQLDTRSLRDELIAAGNDPFVSNRTETQQTAVICPSLLFRELVVKPADHAKGKLPEYPAPPINDH